MNSKQKESKQKAETVLSYKVGEMYCASYLDPTESSFHQSSGSQTVAGIRITWRAR